MGNLIMAADGSFADPDEKPQPTPQEVIAAAGEQRPGVEEQDINDGWLIENTRPMDCGNGLMKYSITLPDGLPFECTPFQIEHRRDMTKVWMGAVRQEIVNRAGAAAQATKDAALRARREKQMQGAGILVSDKLPTPEEAAKLASAVKAAPPSPPESARAVIADIAASRVAAPVPASQDPLEYAKQQYAAAMAELSRLEDAIDDATIKAKTATRAVDRWKIVIDTLSGSVPAKEAAELVRKPSGSRAERLAHRLQTEVTASNK